MRPIGEVHELCRQLVEQACSVRVHIGIVVEIAIKDHMINPPTNSNDVRPMVPKPILLYQLCLPQ